MSYRGIFNVHAGLGYGDYLPGVTRQVRVAGGILGTIEQIITGAEHIVSGEFKPGPDGGHHRSTGRPAGDHWEDRDTRRRGRDEPPRNWRDEEPRRGRNERNERDEEPRRVRNWRDEKAPSGKRDSEAARPSVQATTSPRAAEREALSKHMKPDTLDTVDKLLNLPKDEFDVKFNALPLEQKQEIISGYRKAYEGGKPYDVGLDANGNLDQGRLAADMKLTPAGLGGGVSSIKTLTAQELDAVAVAGTINTTVAAQTRPNFDVKTLTTDSILTSGELNKMSAAGISLKQTKLGQSPDAPNLMTDASGKIVGGYSVLTEGTAKQDPTYKFVTREELETKYSKALVAGVEQGLRPSAPGDVTVAASNKPQEAPPAEPLVKSTIAMNLTSPIGSFKA